MKFLFGNNDDTPKPDKSIIYRQDMTDETGVISSLVEVDLSAVSKKTGIEDVDEITKAVITSIWRIKIWNVLS